MSNGNAIFKISASIMILQFIMVLLIVNGWTTATLPSLSPFGEQRIAVIPVYTQDYYPKHNISEIYSWVFQNASDWIYEMSYERTWLSGEVTPWLYLDVPLSIYGENTIGGEENLVKDAITKADPLIDFSQFDRVLVVHAGPSWQNSIRNGSFPSNSYNNVIFTTMDLKTFPERIVFSEECGIYTIIHELCHALGAVDLYNRPLSYGEVGAKNDSYVSIWCIMASGSHLCLFNKMKMGYVSGHDIYRVTESSGTIDLVGIEQQGKGYRGIRYDRVNDSCYYLIEARNSDYLGARSGVLVTVVDENKAPGEGIVDLVSAAENGSEQWATFKVGDSFHDRTNDFVMHVVARSINGFRVSVGTSSCIDTSSTIVLPSKYGADSLYDFDLSECVHGLVYCALSRTAHEPQYLSYIDVYRSGDSGRTWTFVYNTTDLHLNISQGSIAMLNGNPVLIAHYNNLTHRQYLLLNWTSNLSLFVLDTETGYHGMSCSSGEEVVYISWANVSTANGKRYVNNAIWNGATLTRLSSYENFTSPIVSNPSSSLPVVLCRDALETRRFALFNFDSPALIETWRNETPGSSWITERGVVKSHNEVYVTFEELVYLGNPVYAVRVIKGTSTSGFNQIARFENSTFQSLFALEDKNISYVGLLVGNWDEQVTRLVNLTDSNKYVTVFQTHDSLSVPSWTSGGTGLLILSYKSGIGTLVYQWKIYIGPSSPVEEVLYSVHSTYIGVSQLQFYMVLLILFIVPCAGWLGLPQFWKELGTLSMKPYGKRVQMRFPYTFVLLLWDLKRKSFRERILLRQKKKINLSAMFVILSSPKFILPIIVSILLSGIYYQVMNVPFISSSTYQMMWLTSDFPQVLPFWGFIAFLIIGLNWIITKGVRWE